MELTPQIFTAKVMHKRTVPKVNQFTYSVYYLALPLSQLHQQSVLKVNRPGAMSLHEKDFGARDGSGLHKWARQQLHEYKLDAEVHEIIFIAMPRILGYGFNPVSFYLCLDAAGQLRAFIAEVHNTFGEGHSYIGANADGRAISADDWIQADKLFHVSPFLAREGHYCFRIAHQATGKLGIWIDYVNPDGETQLLTSLTGKLQPLTKAALMRVTEGDVVAFAAICLLSGMAFGAELALPPSMLADLIQKHAQNAHASLQFSFLTFLLKTAAALASLLVFGLLDIAGLKPGEVNSQQALFYLSLSYALIPCFIKAGAAYMLYASLTHHFNGDQHVQNLKPNRSPSHA